MAFNEILVGRLNRYVQKLLVIKNTALRTLSPDLVCTMQIQNGVEDRYLQGWQRFMFTTTSPAVAASNSTVQLRNPANSGVIAVIEKLNIMPGTAASLVQVQIINLSTDAATALTMTANRIDRRGQPAPTLIPSQGTVGAIGAIGQAIFRMLGLVAGNVEFIATVNQELTILPGDALVTLNEVQNEAQSTAIMWRERVLESSELT